MCIKAITVLLACLLALTTTTWAGENPPQHAKVIQVERFDVSPPLRDIPSAFVLPEFESEISAPLTLPRPQAVIPAQDPVVQQNAGPMQMPATLSNFPGLGVGFPGFIMTGVPPDTNMAVGPSHILQIVNSMFVVLSKSGATVLGPKTINTLWSGFGGGCETNHDGDPIAQYDRLADRWIVTEFFLGNPRFTAPFFECVAVSTSGDPTGSYYRYSYSYGSNIPDYPKMGVWPDAYYISYNLFATNFAFLGGEICALDRNKMLAGQPATQQCFQTTARDGGLLPSDLDGSTPPPAGAPNYVVDLGFSGTALNLWSFHVDWVTPANSSFTGPTVLTTAPYNATCYGGGTCIPQAGTTWRLDSLADRLMYRLAYRNFGDHEALVVNHSVATNADGTGSGVRWYEIRIASGIPSIFQQGTYGPDANFRWMGSVAMNGTGDMALGFSVSGSTLYPAIRYTGRLANDPPGQMPQGEGSMVEGAGSENGPYTRWGDYSAMRVDPSDDCTFWYTTEYYATMSGSFNWRTQIASFQFPSCGTTHFSVSAPANTTAGNPLSITVTALDQFNNTTPAYLGTVHFTSSDPQAALPGDSTLSNGVGTFPVTLKTAGNRSITAADTVASSISGSAPVVVSAAAAKSFSWNVPLTASVGFAFSAALTALDNFNNAATSYTGSVQLSTTGTPTVTLPTPNPYTFTSGAGNSDNGAHTFNGFMVTSGTQGNTFTITANDAGTPITATSPAILVTNDAPITGAGRNIHMFRSNVPVVIASFIDADMSETGTHLSASINWGDGNTTPGTVVQVGSTNVFNVTGAHNYAKKKLFTVTVTMTDSNGGAGNGSMATATSTVRFFPINSSR